MRQTMKTQLELDAPNIEQLEFDPKSRDDIPKLLRGLQLIYQDKKLLKEVLELMRRDLGQRVDLRLGRPGMDLWRILVCGTLKQGLDCDYDRLHDFANRHADVRAMLGHGTEWGQRYECQTLINNVNLLTPEVLSKINQLVVLKGHRLLERGGPQRGRCDSFVVKTDVHFPTDANLLWDAMRVLLRQVERAASVLPLSGWRQLCHLRREVKGKFRAVTRYRTRGAAHKKAVRDYWRLCVLLIERVEETLDVLREQPHRESEVKQWERYLEHARRQAEQLHRRVLQGQVIAHKEKVFSLFEEHTRWISKGKVGCLAELGVPVCVIEDELRFVLHYKIMWSETDVEMAVPMVQEVQARYPEFHACSYDKGFHSPQNRQQLDGLLQENTLPRKGRGSEADRARERQAPFVKARRQHSAVESAIHSLGCHGLGRVRSSGADGFERTVGLSVLAYNLHRLGALDRALERDGERRRTRRRAA